MSGGCCSSPKAAPSKGQKASKADSKQFQQKQELLREAEEEFDAQDRLSGGFSKGSQVTRLPL